MLVWATVQAVKIFGKVKAWMLVAERWSVVALALRLAEVRGAIGAEAC